MTSILRCAHISDLHFSKTTLNPSQFFSKRWIGNLNLILSRKRQYTPENLQALIHTFKDLGITHVFITGDLSSTSLESEFSEAQAFVASLKKEGMQVFTIPGNHDQYTKQAYRDQLFYEFFDSRFSDDSSSNLKKDKVSARYLGQKWWVVGLDTAIATPLLCSSGYFSPELEENLEKVLSSIPSDEHILLMNHFPFFELGSSRNTLIRREALRTLLEKHPNIRFYLHGHNHRHCVADLRANNLPIIVDSGSTAHNKIGSWNMLEMSEDRCKVEVYRWKETLWAPSEEHLFNW